MTATAIHVVGNRFSYRQSYIASCIKHSGSLMATWPWKSVLSVAYLFKFHPFARIVCTSLHLQFIWPHLIHHSHPSHRAQWKISEMRHIHYALYCVCVFPHWPPDASLSLPLSLYRITFSITIIRNFISGATQ